MHHFIRKLSKYGFVYGEDVFVNLPTLESACAIPFSLLILWYTTGMGKQSFSGILPLVIVMWMWYVITWQAEAEIATK